MAGLDLPAALFRTMPIELNESLRSRWVGTRAEVELTINAQGEVEAVKVLRPDDDQLAGILGAGLRHWLFIPQVSRGKPASSTQRFQVPLQ